jgi:hypothetical protein
MRMLIAMFTHTLQITRHLILLQVAAILFLVITPALATMQATHM